MRLAMMLGVRCSRESSACRKPDLLTLQAFREDRTLICAMDYIAEALGPRFVESVPLNMERAWAESHPRCPLICLLSPGALPSPATYNSSRARCKQTQHYGA